jgi:hypothetical protein
MMSPPFPARALAAVSLLVALGGCGLFKTNEEVLATVNKRAIGTPVGDFFDRYGRPRSRSERADGSTEYDWISSGPYARPGVEGLDDRVCKLHLGADPRGRINRVEVTYDAPGINSTSRCGEIFAAG